MTKYRVKRYGPRKGLVLLYQQKNYRKNGNKIFFNFIHIGKCGGTSVNNSFKNGKDYRWKQTHNNPVEFQQRHKGSYILWLRNPFNRFVSAFNYAYSPLLPHSTKDNYGNPHPTKIRKLLKTGHAHNKDKDKLLKYFKTPNYLATSLFSSNKELRNKARKLMTHSHVRKGIAFYLDHNKFFNQHYKEILFIGSIENMKEDWNTLSKILKITPPEMIHKRQIKSKRLSTYLSPKAINNLKLFYRQDFEYLKILCDHKMIDEELWKSYQTYSNE